VLEHSPATHVRRPRLDYESHTVGLDRNEVGAMLVAADLSGARDHALVSLLALNGLRVSEAIGAEIERLGRWEVVFPGVASLQLDAGGGGIPYSLRITKKEGVPIHLVGESEPGSAVAAIRKIDKLGFYNMGLRKLAQHFPDLSEAKIGAAVAELRLREDDECYAEFSIDSQHYKRYSNRARERIRDALPMLDLDAVWEAHKPRRRR
jgi:hypothetical protein